jgi:hypothetical protein
VVESVAWGGCWVCTAEIGLGWWFALGLLPCRSGGDPCRSGGHPRPSLPPGVAVPTGMSFAKLSVAGIFGLLEFLLLEFLFVWLL